MTFNFDEIIDRRNSASYKWDTTPEGVLPMWVADMDFRTAPAIIEALTKRVAHGVFGYTAVPDEYYSALTDWFESRHGYTINRDHVIYTSGVVPAVSAVIKAMTKPGDGVIVQIPAYNCFFSSIRNNGCRQIDNPLRRIDHADGGFSYELDFDQLEQCAARDDAKVLLFCNPHNPSGRAWSRDELQRVAEICRRHGVTVISDEIHCELTMPGHAFTSLATLPKEYTAQAIICNSPSKAFNTAGLQIANIIAPDAAQRAAIDRAINDNEVCDVNPFGIVGLIAAYRHGGEWLDALKAYLAENYRTLREFFAEHFPAVAVCELQATYLVWVDVSRQQLSADEIVDRLIDTAHVRLASGSTYGDSRYLRINIACPRRQLVNALEAIASSRILK
jgi:cystathionine beta-lyase